MKLAFVLFKYFPFGGLQRDMCRIAQECQSWGHEIHVYCLTWEGEIPDGFSVHQAEVKRLSNYAKYQAFYQALQSRFVDEGIDYVIGFNRMPGLDLYYAADSCFKEKMSHRSKLIQFSPRYRHFLDFEAAVFGPDSKTHALLISPTQREDFLRHYNTPPERLHLLPPGIARDRMVPPDAVEIRREFREEFGLAEDDRLLLAIGSGFKTKGLDRTLEGIKALPEQQKSRTRLIAMGSDNPKPFIKMAKQLGLEQQFEIMSGRDDVPRFLQGGDLLIHPAYTENTGTVLLEALVAGLPVLTTATCGYAFHVEQSGGGRVVPSPFDQGQLNRDLAEMLDSPQREQWRNNGIHYGQTEDLYSMPELAAGIILKQVYDK
ncbi:glycosyltransferase family 4 protein [Pseudomonadota bacterium]